MPSEPNRRLAAALLAAMLLACAGVAGAATLQGSLTYADLPIASTFSQGTFQSASVRAWDQASHVWTTGTVNLSGSSYQVQGLSAGTYNVSVLLSPASGRQADGDGYGGDLLGTFMVTVSGEPTVTQNFGLLYVVRFLSPYDGLAVWPGSAEACPYGVEAPDSLTVAWAAVPRAVRYDLRVNRASCPDTTLRRDTIHTLTASAVVTQGEVAGERYISFVVEAMDEHGAVLSAQPVITYTDRNGYAAVHTTQSPGRLPGSAGQHVAAAAHVSGVPPTFWKSDLILTNPTTGDITSKVYYTPRDADGLTDYLEAQVDVPAGRCRTFQDVVSSLFGASGGGAVEVASPILIVASRTYTPAAGGGSYGQGYPPIPNDHLAFQAGVSRLVGGPVAKGAMRTNVTLNEVSGASVTVKVELYDGTGAKLGEREETLDPYGTTQINDVVGKLSSLSTLQDGHLRVSVISGSGKVAGTLSIVDNTTGDPTTIALLPR